MVHEVTKSRGLRILFVALLALLFFMTLYFASSRRSILGADGMQFIRAAERAMDNPSSLLSVQSKRPPLYPAILCASFSLFGKTLLSLHVFPFLIMLASPFLFYFLVRRVSGSSWWALLASYILILFPNSRDMMSHPLAASFSAFFMILAMLLVDLSGERKRYFIVLLPCLLCLFLLKYELALAAVIFAGCGFFRFLETGYNRKRGLMILLSALILIILVMVFSQVFMEKEVVPRRLLWQLQSFLARFENPMNEIYLSREYASLIREDLTGYFSFPVPLLLLILLGGIYTTRIKRKYLLWYFLIPVTLYSLIFLIGYRHLMVPLFTPVTPVLSLFLTLGIAFSFTLARERVKFPYRAGVYAGLGLLVLVVIFSAYRRAAGHWFSESLFRRNTASISRLMEKNVEMHPPVFRTGSHREFFKFEEELLDHVAGFCRSPHYLSLWDLRCGGEAIQITFEKDDWRSLVHAAYAGDRPIPPFEIASPATSPSLNHLELIFRLALSRPVHTLHYTDRHSTPGKDDWIRFSISPDGHEWLPGYFSSHQGETVTWGAHFRQGISNRSEVYLKYELYSGDLKQDKNNAGGARLEGIYLGLDFLPCKPFFGEDWPVVYHEGD